MPTILPHPESLSRLQEFGELYPADIRKQERQAAAAARRLQNKAMAQLETSSADQAAALVEALQATARGLGLNTYQAARLQYRVTVQQRIASAAVRAAMRDRAAVEAVGNAGMVGEEEVACRAAASGHGLGAGCSWAEVSVGPSPSSPPGVEDSSSDSDGATPPRAKRAAQRSGAQGNSEDWERGVVGGDASPAVVEWDGLLNGGEGQNGEEGGWAGRTRNPWDDRGEREPAIAGAVATLDGAGGARYGRRSTPPTDSALALSEQRVETAAAAKERVARDRALAGGRRGVPPVGGTASTRDDASAEPRRRQPQGGRGVSSPHSRPMSTEAEAESPRSAYDERKEAAAARRAAADHERTAAILRRMDGRMEDRTNTAKVSPRDGSCFADTGGRCANELSTYADRREAAESRRGAADAARREATVARRRNQPPSTEWAEDELMAPPVYEERRQAALAKKAAAEAVRMDAISSRARRQSGTRADGPGAMFDEAELYAPSAAEEKQEAAAARRAAAEAARREVLLAKVAVGGRATSNPLGASADHRAEAARVEAAMAALPPDASQATVMGLRKQLATHRAALVREQRKREQAERETRREAEARSSREEQGAVCEEEEGE